jgi:hypothetical protein
MQEDKKREIINGIVGKTRLRVHSSSGTAAIAVFGRPRLGSSSAARRASATECRTHYVSCVVQRDNENCDDTIL